MNRTILFDSPFLLGFDHTRALIERAAKAAAEGYPPYNVEERTEGRLRISLAVAGFSPEQLSVTVDDNQLVVTGRGDKDRGPSGADRAYLHRGIAARQFQRSFLLVDGMEVLGADLSNGLLSVDLARPEPDRIIRKIAILERE
jgi:HSP20 family molecular chaperone IbpA